MAIFYKSHENALSRVFLHAEFISALKTDPKAMVFEKNAKNKKNIYHDFLFFFFFFVIFSKKIQAKLLNTTESCFFDGKNTNKAKLVDINFLADSEKIARKNLPGLSSLTFTGCQ